MEPDAAKALIGRNVRALRLDLGLTQEELAYRAGLLAPAVSRVERGAADPRASTIARLAEGLDVPLSRLLDEN